MALIIVVASFASVLPTLVLPSVFASVTSSVLGALSVFASVMSSVLEVLSSVSEEAWLNGLLPIAHHPTSITLSLWVMDLAACREVCFPCLPCFPVVNT